MQKQFKFHEASYLGWKINYYPKSFNYKSIIDQLNLIKEKKNYKLFNTYLKNLNQHFSFIAINKNFSIACVDRILSYPIFYKYEKNEIIYSNNANDLISHEYKIDNKKEIEFLMSGYLSGNKTLIKNIYQLEAGSYITSDDFINKNYYLFYPNKIHELNEDELIRLLDKVTNNIFKKLYKNYNNHQIIVPLSGGLDSRFVLAKLCEHKFKDIVAISYGPKFNTEAKIAKSVAEKLSIKWYFYESKNKGSYDLFNSNLRKDYWNYSCNFSRSPNMQEFQFIHDLTQSSLLKDKNIIINGQTGDFITGGHIPTNFIDSVPTRENFINFIIEKHYSLWTNLKNKENINMIKLNIENFLNQHNDKFNFKNPYPYLYNLWEWKERQSKFVISQQKIYDFYNIKWELPLWDLEFMNFWREIPKNYLRDKKLYKIYLQSWNYNDLFLNKKFDKRNLDGQPINRWPGISYLLFLIAKLIGLFFGKKIKNYSFNIFKFFGHYSNYYHSYRFKDFLKKSIYCRNPQSLFVQTYINELKKNKLN